MSEITITVDFDDLCDILDAAEEHIAEHYDDDTTLGLLEKLRRLDAALGKAARS